MTFSYVNTYFKHIFPHYPLLSPFPVLLSLNSPHCKFNILTFKLVISSPHYHTLTFSRTCGFIYIVQ
jgi:hypothetical protein